MSGRPAPTAVSVHGRRRRPRGPLAAVATMGAAATAAGLLAGVLLATPASASVRGGDGAVLAAPLPATTRMASFDARMISLVNGARASAGAPPVHEAGGLTQLSVWWSTQMAVGKTGYQLEHNPNAWTMVTQYGASNRTAWAENVASFPTAASAQAVFDAYMNSPGHRANILNGTYRYIGMGTVSGSHGAYNTMEFTDKVEGASEPAPKPTTSKPRPSTPKPAPSTSTHRAAPSTTHQQPPATTRPPTTQPAAPTTAAYRPPPSTQDAPDPQDPADDESGHDSGGSSSTAAPARGALVAAFGTLPLGGLTFAIRGADCHGTVTTATTRRDGRAPVSVAPGTYCAVPLSAPKPAVLPAPRTFTATSGDHFTVAWKHLKTTQVWWGGRPGLKRPV